MTDAEAILRTAKIILVIDWPSRDVPDGLAVAGYTVFVKGGPGPGSYSVVEVIHGQVVTRPAANPPSSVDLVYAHRPISELYGIIALASRLRATAVWRQSGLAPTGVKDPKGCWVTAEESNDARRMVEAGGLRFVDDAYITDVACSLEPPQ
ncbi:MAG TPA: CoA-binding protein [Chloroflexota bacterium]|jgi:predicted CoA-binding protein|nr:CoA-binding protein [Chloroflexota bacterium]